MRLHVLRPRLLARFQMSVLLLWTLLPGCSGIQAKHTFEDARALSEQGKYTASLQLYQQMIQESPGSADAAIFEMGIIYSRGGSEEQDLRKASECFQRILRDFPASRLRQDSQTMVFYLEDLAAKDRTIAAQKTHIDALERETSTKDGTIGALQERIKELERRNFALAAEKGSVDKVLILKAARKLTLLSKGEVLKTYKIALGGNPSGPKERQGDNKTPEGTYAIDGRNTESKYHLSLHISYPNERDRKRARELGVSPGGDIMIHGIKNGFSAVGENHAQVDWTKGCIAVTDEEIEEIARAVPNGTTVEIRP